MDFDILFKILVALSTLIATWAITRWYYKKGERVKQLSWTTKVDRFVDKSAGILGDIRLEFDGALVSRPRVETIFIWNSGSETINGSDISKIDPLNVSHGDAKIISLHDVVDTRKSVSSRPYNVDENKILIDFDYLDPNDGFRFSVLLDIEEEYFGSYARLKGSVKGMTNGIKSENHLFLNDNKSVQGMILGSAGGGLFLAVTVLLSIDVYFSFDWSVFILAKSVSALVTGIITFAVFGITFEDGLKVNRVPSNLLRPAEQGGAFESPRRRRKVSKGQLKKRTGAARMHEAKA